MCEEASLSSDVLAYTHRAPVLVRKKYNTTVSHGEPKTLQGDGSDVSLAIPVGSQGVYMTRVHTDHLQFKGIIPPEECLIGPPTEVEQINFENQTPTRSKYLYRVNIPHCLMDKELWKHIIVRRGDVYRHRPFREMPRRNPKDEEDFGFEVDNKYITIHTDGFSQFICTCGKTVCTASVLVFVMGSMNPGTEVKGSSIKLKNFLCSFLYNIEDYKQVLYFQIQHSI